jgi:hypothetical protein
MPHLVITGIAGEGSLKTVVSKRNDRVRHIISRITNSQFVSATAACQTSPKAAVAEITFGKSLPTYGLDRLAPSSHGDLVGCVIDVRGLSVDQLVWVSAG